MIKKIDKRASQLGYLIYKSNEMYSKQLSRNAFVFVQRNDENFMAYRMTFEKNGPKPVSDKSIVNNTDILNAFKRAEAYIPRYKESVENFKKNKLNEV